MAVSFEAGGVRARRMVPETWRVVFSSTGDLTPAGTLARGGEPPSRAPISAARFPVAAVESALDAVRGLLIHSDRRISTAPLVRLSTIPLSDRCPHWLEPIQAGCSTSGEALAFPLEKAVPLCGMRRRVPPNFDFTVSIEAYCGTVPELLHLLNYEQLGTAGARVAAASVARVYRTGNIAVAGRETQPTRAQPIHRSNEEDRTALSEAVAR